MRSTWVQSGLLVAILSGPGCSFTNAFEVPAVVGEWRRTVASVSDDGTQRGVSTLRFSENGSGAFTVYFGVGDDPDLYFRDYAIRWSTTDDRNYEVTLECLEDSSPLGCPATMMPETMPCELDDGDPLLTCAYPGFDNPVFFVPVSP